MWTVAVRAHKKSRGQENPRCVDCTSFKHSQELSHVLVLNHCQTYVTLLSALNHCQTYVTLLSALNYCQTYVTLLSALNYCQTYVTLLSALATNIPM